MLLLTRAWLEMSETDCVDQNAGEVRVGQAERRHRDQTLMEVEIKQKRERRCRGELAGAELMLATP